MVGLEVGEFLLEDRVEGEYLLRDPVVEEYPLLVLEKEGFHLRDLEVWEFRLLVQGVGESPLLGPRLLVFPPVVQVVREFHLVLGLTEFPLLLGLEELPLGLLLRGHLADLRVCL